MRMTQTNTPKQYDTVYHIDFGKGTIVHIQYRKDCGLCMCYFPKVKEHDWITVTQLISGAGEITLQPLTKNSKDETVSDDLHSALENLFFGGKR